MSWFGILMTIIFSGHGLFGAWFAHKVLNLNNSVLFGSLFFVPTLAYLVFSGQLSEFKGFGVEIRLFREASEKKIEIKAGSISDIKTGTRPGELQSFFAGGSEVVILNADEASKQSETPLLLAFKIAEEISANLLQGKFELLVVDNQMRVLGSFAKNWFLDIPSIPDIHVSRGYDNDFDQNDKKRIKRNLSKTILWGILLNLGNERRRMAYPLN